MSQRPPQLPAVIVSQPGVSQRARSRYAELLAEALDGLHRPCGVEAFVLVGRRVEERERRVVRVRGDRGSCPTAMILPSSDSGSTVAGASVAGASLAGAWLAGAWDAGAWLRARARRRRHRVHAAAIKVTAPSMDSRPRRVMCCSSFARRPCVVVRGGWTATVCRVSPNVHRRDPRAVPWLGRLRAGRLARQQPAEAVRVQHRDAKVRRLRRASSRRPDRRRGSPSSSTRSPPACRPPPGPRPRPPRD